jgi:hypothetical protein
VHSSHRREGREEKINLQRRSVDQVIDGRALQPGYIKSNLDGGTNSPRCNVGHRVISKRAEICNFRPVVPFGAKIRLPAQCLPSPQTEISYSWRCLNPWTRTGAMPPLGEVSSSLSTYSQSARRSNSPWSQSTPVEMSAKMFFGRFPIDARSCREDYPSGLNFSSTWVQVNWLPRHCFRHGTTLSPHYVRS